jgi:mercuric reductase
MVKKRKKDEISLVVKGMTCDSCAIHVKTALGTVEGVTMVDVPDWRSESARVIADSSVSDKDLVAAVRSVGYTVEGKRRSEIVQELMPPVIPKTNGYDIVVIGTGGAGMAAAIKAAELGYKVALIERGEIGGTCVNIGCIPSKTLIRAAEAYHNAGNNPFQGVITSAGEVTWKEVLFQKDALVSQLQKEKYMDVLAEYQEQITRFTGLARLTSAGEVQLED